MRLFESLFGRGERHCVEVHDVRPTPDDPDPFAPYFAALCECGWLDVAHASEATARAAAHLHDVNVVKGLKRPLG